MQKILSNFTIHLLDSNTKNWNQAQIIGVLERHSDPNYLFKRLFLLKKIGRNSPAHLLVEASATHAKFIEILNSAGLNFIVSQWDLPHSKEILDEWMQPYIKVSKALKDIEQKTNSVAWQEAFLVLRKIEIASLPVSRSSYPILKDLINGTDENFNQTIDYYKQIGEEWKNNYLIKMTNTLFPSRQQALIHSIQQLHNHRLIFFTGYHHAHPYQSSHPQQVALLITELAKHTYSLIEIADAN